MHVEWMPKAYYSHTHMDIKSKINFLRPTKLSIIQGAHNNLEYTHIHVPAHSHMSVLKYMCSVPSTRRCYPTCSPSRDPLRQSKALGGPASRKWVGQQWEVPSRWSLQMWRLVADAQQLIQLLDHRTDKERMVLWLMVGEHHCSILVVLDQVLSSSLVQKLNFCA